MKDKLGQEPAFATSALLGAGEAVFQEGMSKRFYAACAAMQGILSGQQLQTLPNDLEIVEMAYELADELLKQESE